MKVDILREEPLMVWGGGSGERGKKNSTATRPGKKPHQPVGQEKKLNTRPPQIINGPSLTDLQVILLHLNFKCPINTGWVRDVATKLVVSSCEPAKINAVQVSVAARG